MYKRYSMNELKNFDLRFLAYKLKRPGLIDKWQKFTIKKISFLFMFLSLAKIHNNNILSDILMSFFKIYLKIYILKMILI